ncbi:hypothetical protein CLAIMM_14045 [Cladophialophora immunda]|nr:hypothetical protein CLAIMM_14045 [Cladophialophora immunda]
MVPWRGVYALLGPALFSKAGISALACARCQKLLEVMSGPMAPSRNQYAAQNSMENKLEVFGWNRPKGIEKSSPIVRLFGTPVLSVCLRNCLLSPMIPFGCHVVRHA